MEEIGALVHFQGEGAVKNQVNSGKLSEATVKGVNGAKYTNSSSLAYLKKVNEHIEKSGNSYISKSDLIDGGINKKQSKEQIIAEYDKREAAIDANEDTTQGQKEIQRKALRQATLDSGNLDIINENIENKRLAYKDGLEKHAVIQKFFIE